MFDPNVTVVVLAAAAYFLLMLVIGRVSARGAGTGSQAYFVASRKLRGFVLFASVFGTNMTAFVMLGLAGQTYRLGLGTWGMLAGAVVLTLPIHFYFGYRCWLVARRYGYTSPAEFYRERYASPALGVLAFVFFVAWVLPVILTGIIGSGRVFEEASRGAIPYWLGALIVTAVVGYYTTVGGMRATAWTNVAQTCIFLSFLVLAVLWVPAVTGGPGRLFEQLQAEAPQLLTRSWGAAGWGPALSFFLLFSMANFATPYIWIRMISAQSGQTARRLATYYPIAVLSTWVPAILLGLWGAVLVPGLEGTASDSVIFVLSGELFPTWMVAFGMLGLFAIVMSSMDAQALTLSNFFTVDVLQRYTRLRDSLRVVRSARLFVLGLLVLLYLIALLPLPAVFSLSTFAFTGFMAFFPLMVGGVLWRRATRAGALTSLLVGQIVAIAGYLQLYPPVLGLMPPFWVAVSSSGSFIVVSLLTTPPDSVTVERFHGEWDRVWRRNPPAGRVPTREPATETATETDTETATETATEVAAADGGRAPSTPA
ncbi:MAG: sodium:solute symporter family protein [Streptomycetales bacterium]